MTEPVKVPRALAETVSNDEAEKSKFWVAVEDRDAPTVQVLPAAGAGQREFLRASHDPARPNDESQRRVSVTRPHVSLSLRLPCFGDPSGEWSGPSASLIAPFPSMLTLTWALRCVDFQSACW